MLQAALDAISTGMPVMLARNSEPWLPGSRCPFGGKAEAVRPANRGVDPARFRDLIMAPRAPPVDCLGGNPLASTPETRSEFQDAASERLPIKGSCW